MDDARQILQNRVEYETRSNQTINSFVLPYCAYKNATDSLCPLRIGEALFRSGALGSPEYFQELEAEYGMPEGSWGTSRLFDIDDRNPSMERYDNAVASCLKGMKPGEVRHATLGLHTWQNDAGFETLDKIFAKYANRPDWWYCNENEYNAYRYAQLHTRVEKRVEGANAIFKLTGPTPAALGSDTPLWAKVTPATADGRTMVKLPHTLRMPEQMRITSVRVPMIRAADILPSMARAQTAPTGIRIFRAYSLNVSMGEASMMRARYRTVATFAISEGCICTPRNEKLLSSPRQMGTMSSIIANPMAAYDRNRYHFRGIL